MTLELPQLKWDMRLLNKAKEVASWSKDPSTQVGAVIYDEFRRPVSEGYNGLPADVDWGVDEEILLQDRDFKLINGLHAEENAIYFSTRLDLRGCTIYTYPFMPCAHCASALVQKKIKRVVSFKNNVIRWAANMEQARKTFAKARYGVELVEYDNEELSKKV
jgi:dCMP deaminase